MGVQHALVISSGVSFFLSCHVHGCVSLCNVSLVNIGIVTKNLVCDDAVLYYSFAGPYLSLRGYDV